MNKNRIILQGEVYICDLGDSIDSEQGGNNRPSIIIQIDILNKTSPNTIIVPITSKDKPDLPTHFILTKNKYKFLKYKNNTILCEGIRSISKRRVGKYLGNIDKKDLQEILKLKEYAFVEKTVDKR